MLMSQQLFCGAFGKNKMSQGSVLIHVPKLSDGEIFIDEDEARIIFKFYWPDSATQIASMQISTEARRFAQQVLIAGVNASYALGYIDILFNSLGSGPKGGVKSILKKLSKNSAKHWFKNASGKNLQSLEIYEAARKEIARSKRTDFLSFLLGIARANDVDPRFFAHLNTLPKMG
jgi:hypothetical protein